MAEEGEKFVNSVSVFFFVPFFLSLSLSLSLFLRNDNPMNSVYTKDGLSYTYTQIETRACF